MEVTTLSLNEEELMRPEAIPMDKEEALFIYFISF